MEREQLVECVSTGGKLPESLAKILDERMKTQPAECKQLVKKSMPAEIQFEPNERAEVSIITTDAVDLSGEVVLPRGLHFEHYNSTGRVVLWNHDWNLPPIAKCKWIKEYKDRVRAKTEYPRIEKDSGGPSWIDEIWDMVHSRVINAKSISGLPNKPWREATQDELEMNPLWKGAKIWEDVDLWEYSCVSIGCNQEALVEAVSKGFNQQALKEMGFKLPEVDPRQKALEETLLLCKGDDCVSKKIKFMYDNGEDKKYSKEQIAAIAYAHCHGKKVEKAKPVKKAFDHNKALAKALDNMNLDVNAIVQRAIDAYKNRGRV